MLRTRIALIAAIGAAAGAVVIGLAWASSATRCTREGGVCVHGPSIYVSQTTRGTGRGVSCATAHSAAWFDDSANWQAGPRRIRPGTIVHLCGAIRSMLSVRGAGRPGRRIFIVFEPGAKLSEPVCDPCLEATHASFITVDGGRDGTIESTQVGSSLPYHVPSRAIDAMNCQGCTFENLTIRNMYVHTSPSDHSVDATQDNAIRFSGRNIVIAHDRIHDVGWALYASWSSGDGQVRIYGNRITRVDHGFASTSGFAGGAIGPIYFYDNRLSDFANWDTAGDAYHHDGIHCYTVDGAGTASHYVGLYIYDNRFGGTVGANATADIFMEGAPRGDSGDTPCADPGSSVYIFNNVLTSTDQVTDNYYLSDSAGGGATYNNTIIGQSNRVPRGGCAGYGDQPAGGRAAFQNNLLSSCNNLTNGSPTGDYAPGSPDFNVYANGGDNSFVCAGSFFTFRQFRRWKDCMHADSHSRAVSDAKLDAAGAPAPRSPAIGAGTNLTALCRGPLMPLCRSIDGQPRPRHGAWHAGAY